MNTEQVASGIKHFIFCIFGIILSPIWFPIFLVKIEYIWKQKEKKDNKKYIYTRKERDKFKIVVKDCAFGKKWNVKPKRYGAKITLIQEKDNFSIGCVSYPFLIKRYRNLDDSLIME
jgi:hypothetical protein